MGYNVDVRTRLPALLLSLLAVFTATTAHAYSEPWIPGSSSNRVGAFTGVTPQNRIGGYQLATWLSEADLELQLGGSTKANWLSITANASGSGLFLQRDPVGFADSVNLYAGMAWDPVNKRDPTGRASREGYVPTRKPGDPKRDLKLALARLEYVVQCLFVDEYDVVVASTGLLDGPQPGPADVYAGGGLLVNRVRRGFKYFDEVAEHLDEVDDVLVRPRAPELDALFTDGPTRDAMSIRTPEAEIVRANAEAGARRHIEEVSELSTTYPEATTQTEHVLLSADGNPVLDPITRETRRLDTVVIDHPSGVPQVLDVVETTSQMAPKRSQIAKERRIREAGGVYIRDRVTGELVPVGPSRISRRE